MSVPGSTGNAITSVPPVSPDGVAFRSGELQAAMSARDAALKRRSVKDMVRSRLVVTLTPEDAAGFRRQASLRAAGSCCVRQ